MMMFITSILMYFSLLCVSTDSPNSDEQRPMMSLIRSSFEESFSLINKAANESRHSIRSRSPSSLEQMFVLSRQAASETQEISKAAEIFHMTLQFIKEKTHKRQKRSLPVSDLVSVSELKRIAELSGCVGVSKSSTCSEDRKYRSISGVCNNRQNPLWGSANAPLTRWLAAQYEDNETQPKGWNTGQQYNGYNLPPVRDVSIKLMQSSSTPLLKDNEYSQMLVDWGQYIDHDISFTPQTSSQTLNCLHNCKNDHTCFPIQISRNDKLSGSKDCLPFFRSSPACPDLHRLDSQHMLQRQQMNSVTSFIDASTVYGHSEQLEKALRNVSSSDGLLAVNTRHTDNGRAYLPSVSGGRSSCFQQPGSQEDERVECWVAGDSRVNEILTLSALHTLWLREHNRVAKHLRRLNPHWRSEVIYQETRKIIGALHQIITLRDYIPKIIGQESFDKYLGAYKGYNSTLNPSVSNVFATAAFRFGHATISPTLKRLNESFQEHEHFSSVNLHQTFFSPWRLLKEGGLDPVLRGLLGRSAALQNQDQLMTEELTERLVVLNIPASLDLASLNLQRGRDHALPGYNDWRTFCGLKRIESESDLLKVVGGDVLLERILEVYGHMSNIDVWLGGLMERPLPDARTGPLFACLIAKQMKMLREGDRFWWENPDLFSFQQRQELEKHSLSRVICDNSGVMEVPPDSFRAGHYPEDFSFCQNIPSLDLEAWKENPDNRTG